MELVDLLINYGKAWHRLTKSHINLFMLEAKLARSSIAPLIISILFCFVILLSLWLITLALIGYAIYFYSHYILFALLITFIINLLFLLLILKLVFAFYRNLQFKRTRIHFHSYKKIQFQGDYEDKTH